MVLMMIIWLLFGPQPGTDLYDEYHKVIHKKLTRSFGKVAQEYEKLTYPYGDLRRVKVQSKVVGHFLIAEVAACHLGGCTLPEVVNNTDREYFDALVIFDDNQNILSLSILDYFSDYGYELTSKRYLKKFIGKPICDFEKEIDGIDAISGATVSCAALENTLALLCGSDQFN